MEQKEIIVKHIDTRSVMTKSNTPIGGYSVNPYVGCPHACKYCYASFMKRFTGHTEDWGTFMDVKNWPVIKNPKKYAGQKVVIGTVTDGYNPLEETYRNTRRLLEELKDSGADILICTKSDLVLQDIDLLKEINKNNRLTVSWSVNTLDEDFKNDMDSAVSIERRLAAMKQVYDAGIRTICFISPVFPGITDIEAIFESFSSTKSNLDLIVVALPSASVYTYMATLPWSEFGSIIAITNHYYGIYYEFNTTTKQATVISREKK